MGGFQARSVLLLVDRRETEDSVRAALGEKWRPVRATSVEDALALLAAEPVAGIVAEDSAAGGRGLELLVQARERAPHAFRVLASAAPSVELSLRAINEARVSAVLAGPADGDTAARVVGPVARACEQAWESDERLATLEDRTRELTDERRALSLALEDKASALARLQKSLESLSSRDERTGLFNERHFHLRAEQELKRARRYGLPLSVVLCDFLMHDEPGTTRDRVLVEALLSGVGRLLAPGGRAPARVRDTDVVARYGEHGFGLLLPDTRKAGAEVVTSRVRAAVAGASLAPSADAGPLALVVGIAAFPDDASSRGELLERADQALYQATRESPAPV